MQTRFTEAQLRDPDLAESERILRTCVHCGLCSATCPTYVLRGDELDSPRGRIYLIKDMLENDRPATGDVVQHIDRCLSCLACMTTCPSGVHYQHLIDHARVHIERTHRRPWVERAMRAALAAVLPYPERFRAALQLARLLRPAARLLPGRLERMLSLVPAGEAGRRRPGAQREVLSGARETSRSRCAPSQAGKQGGVDRGDVRLVNAASGERAGAAEARRPRVAVLSGCVESVLAPQIHASAVRLLSLAGAQVVSVPGCCGAVVHHLGRAVDHRRLAKPLIERLHEEMTGRGLDAIAATASGCGAHVKDYGHVFRADDELAERAAAAAFRIRDVSEILEELGLSEPLQPLGLDVAYHSACSMQHGQRVESAPRALLERAGFHVKEIPEGHLCCGSAGTYNLLQPRLAEQLRVRKLVNIERAGAAVTATGNIGCIAQLGTADGAPVVHTIELLDWAMGGARPAALSARKQRRA